MHKHVSPHIAYVSMLLRGPLSCAALHCMLSTCRCMLWLLARVFERCAIVKPPHSRRVNSERYVVCTGFSREERAACVGRVLSRLTMLQQAMWSEMAGATGRADRARPGKSGARAAKGQEGMLLEQLPCFDEQLIRIVAQDDRFVASLRENCTKIARLQCDALRRTLSVAHDLASGIEPADDVEVEGGEAVVRPVVGSNAA